MLFYDVFVALNNNTILAMQNIEFGSVSSDRYPDPAETASIKAIPILNIGSAHHYDIVIVFLNIWHMNKIPQISLKTTNNTFIMLQQRGLSRGHSPGLRKSSVQKTPLPLCSQPKSKHASTTNPVRAAQLNR